MAPGRGVMAPIKATGQATHICLLAPVREHPELISPPLPPPLPTPPASEDAAQRLSTAHGAVRSRCSSPRHWDGAREAPTAPGGGAQATVVLKSVERL